MMTAREKELLERRKKMFENGIISIRDANRDFMLFAVVFPNEIDSARERLRIAGVSYRTTPKVENGKIVAYKIWVKR